MKLGSVHTAEGYPGKPLGAVCRRLCDPSSTQTIPLFTNDFGRITQYVKVEERYEEGKEREGKGRKGKELGKGI